MKRIFSLILVFVVGLSAKVSWASEPPSTDEALAKLKNSKQSITRAELDEAIQTLRDQARQGDPALWKHLRQIIADEEVHHAIRLETMKLASEKADAVIASDILSMVTEWVLRIDCSALAAEENRPRKTMFASAGMISCVVTSGCHHLEQVVTNQETILDFLKAVAVCPCLNIQTCHRACVAISTNPVPIKMRRRYALDIIASRPRSTSAPRCLVRLLDASSFPTLRKLVRASTNPDTFHYAAAATLAEHGDVEILPDLEARIAPFREVGRKSHEYLQRYIWRINVQNPPSNLLDYIASAEHIRTGGLRDWAIGRAVELGLPKAEIRQAILTHAKQVKPTGKYGIRPGLTSIKKLGLALGLLRPDDLPEVKVPEVKPTS